MTRSQNISASGTPLDVVLFHFGGPTTEAEVEPFLFRLFMDPFILRAPLGPLRRWLAGRISRKRWREANEQYKQIGYSPINRLTQHQANALQAKLREINPDTVVRVVNRYTAPFAAEVVPQIRWDKARVVGLTLYPHLSHSTVVSSLRDFDLSVLEQRGNFPIMTRVYSWWSNPAYLDHTWRLLQPALQEARAKHSRVTVLFSAHGLPRKYVNRGDPYVCDILAHAGELERRGRAWIAHETSPGAATDVTWHVTFQSRVGPVEWMRPYTEQSIVELGKARGGAVLLVPISFVSDHIETLFEMDQTYRLLALASGFSHYGRAIPSNESSEFTDCLVQILRSHGVIDAL